MTVNVEDRLAGELDGLGNHKREGELLPSVPVSYGDPRLPDRFWKKVAVTDSSSCWVWRGAISPNGYGKVWMLGAVWLAHQVAYEGLTGPVPAYLEIDHVCRNRACVNPAHLSVVTHAENCRRSWAARKAQVAA